jgi:hypothetical protein
MYKTRQVSAKHWKRNNSNRISVPTVEDDRNSNNASDKNQPNEIEKPNSTDLRVVSIRDLQTDPILS